METFLPMGSSDVAQNNWLTKIVGGIVGAKPVMPNVAGGSGKAEPQGPSPRAGAQNDNANGKGADARRGRRETITERQRPRRPA